MANTSIQSLNKILVDVPVGKSEDFLSTYGPGVVGRRTDYDNKLVFLHDTHTIITQGDIFGGKETTVGNDNSFIIGSTKYTLTINDGELNISPYTASSLKYAYFPEGSGSATNNQSCEYGTSYDKIDVVATPSNQITYSINHGTTKILLTGIHAKVGSGTYAYVYGGSATIENNQVTHIDNIGNIGVSDYTNDNVVGTLTISGESGVRAEEVSKTVPSGNASSNFTTTSKTSQQTGIVYYHELGKSNLSTKSFTDKTPTTKSSSVTVYKGHFVWVSSEYEEPTTTTGETQKPEQISTNQADGEYAWLAIPVEPEFSSDGKTFIKPVFQGGVLAGGWLPYRVGGDLKDFSKPLVSFTHYNGDTYYVYRTEQAGLGAKNWDIYDYPSNSN